MNKSSIIIAIITSLALIGCGKSEADSNSNNPGGFGGQNGAGRVTSVETQTVTRAPIALQVRSFGTIKAQDVVTINPQVSNRITKMYVDLGDTVRQGQLLAKIYDATFKDQLSQAKSQLAQSKIIVQRDSMQFERQKQLLRSNAISQSEYDIAYATYQNARAQYQSSVALVTQAQESFNNTEVRTPVHGVVISRTGEEGDIASTGQTMFEIANLVGYETRIFLPVQDWRTVKIGQNVQLRVSNEAEATATGVVSRKSPQLDPTTGLGEVVITLTHIGNSIYPGVLTENVIDIINKPRAIVISRSAMVEKVETVIEPESNSIQLKRSYSVFVSQGDSTAILQRLELGIEQGDKIEVLSGLSPGDNIVVTGQQGLQDRGAIRVATGSAFSSPQQAGGTIEGPTSPATARQGARPGGGNAAFANMSDEERTKMRQRLQSMSQTERTALMDSLRTANNSNN